MTNSILLNSAAAVVLGAFAVAAPPFLTMLEPSAVMLLQISLLMTGGAAVAVSIVQKEGGIENIIAALMLLFTGFVIMTNIAGTIPTNEGVDYTFDNNFAENGELSQYMTTADSGTLLTLNETGQSGTYTSDVIYAEENASNIQFNRLTVNMESFKDVNGDTVELRIQTYNDGSLAETHTYNITEEGLQSFNVSKINSLAEVNSFEYRLFIDDDGSDIPEFDTLKVETSQSTEKSTDESGILQFTAFVIYVLGGILVAARIIG